MIQARPTTYRGIPMRSRLEATYARRLDDKGVEWRYEPNAFGGRTGRQYLPDFEVVAVRGDRLPKRCFVEVRPTLEAGYLALTQMLVIFESVPDCNLIVWVSEPRLSWWFDSERRMWRTVWFGET